MLKMLTLMQTDWCAGVYHTLVPTIAGIGNALFFCVHPWVVLRFHWYVGVFADSVPLSNAVSACAGQGRSCWQQCVGRVVVSGPCQASLTGPNKAILAWPCLSSLVVSDTVSVCCR